MFGLVLGHGGVRAERYDPEVLPLKYLWWTWLPGFYGDGMRCLSRLVALFGSARAPFGGREVEKDAIELL